MAATVCRFRFLVHTLWPPFSTSYFPNSHLFLISHSWFIDIRDGNALIRCCHKAVLGLDLANHRGRFLVGLVTSDFHDACVTHDSHDQWSYETCHAEENRVGFIILPLYSTDVLVRQINIPNRKKKNDCNKT